MISNCYGFTKNSNWKCFISLEAYKSVTFGLMRVISSLGDSVVEKPNFPDQLDEKSVSVLALNGQDARHFFLKGESYCNFDLPQYINFDNLLENISVLLEGKKLDMHGGQQGPRACDDVNHVLFHNKDGRYAWRPYQLIHPALYVSLVHCITEDKSWNEICSRFVNSFMHDKISCASLPVKSMSKQSDKAEQVLQWWTDLEQRSIELSLEYEYLAITDIENCYASIYTHSIAWALHDRDVAKGKKRDDSYIGNVIDNHVQDMSCGQTNGIPQGSGLTDFIAEIVLGYADMLIAKEIDLLKICDFHILRYRDDYRVFVNNPINGDLIVKVISNVLVRMGLKLNSLKTKFSNSVVTDSIKNDKIEWIKSVRSNSSLQKHLLLIHDFSTRYPNSGSLIRALSVFHKRVCYRNNINNIPSLISIVVDIAVRNPRTYALSSAILSRLLYLIANEDERIEIFLKIKNRFGKIPNTPLLEIWLQRISICFDKNVEYNEPLCGIVIGNKINIWNSKWIKDKDVRNGVDCKKIIDPKAIDDLKPVIPPDEVELFASY